MLIAPNGFLLAHVTGVEIVFTVAHVILIGALVTLDRPKACNLEAGEAHENARMICVDVSSFTVCNHCDDDLKRNDMP